VGTNRYAYSFNDPVNLSDRNGHNWDGFWRGVGEFFEGAKIGASANADFDKSIKGAAIGAATGAYLGSGVAVGASCYATACTAAAPASAAGAFFGAGTGGGLGGFIGLIIDGGELVVGGINGGINNIGSSAGKDNTNAGAGASAVAAAIANGDRIWITYTKVNTTTGQVYSGRANGNGDPLEILKRRNNGHHMNAFTYGPARLDQVSANYAAIRGREQILINANGGAQSMGGVSGNRINGISPINPLRGYYLEQAILAFGN
jgi:hypothetical protein